MSFLGFLKKIVHFLFPFQNKKDDEKIYTGNITYINNAEIAGVKKGKPMSFEEAGKGVNPNYSHFGNINNRMNCQSCVAVFEARLRGYNIETCIPKDFESIEIKTKLEEKPNIAYIDIKTGKISDCITIKPNDAKHCENILNTTINKSERYLFSFQYKTNSAYNTNEKEGHVLEAIKDEYNILKIYDPQVNKLYDSSFLTNLKYSFDKFEDKIYPKILRIDNKNLNYEVLNKISQPAKL